MYDSGSTAFMLVCTMLVLFMTPGLAFFYGGLARRKNVVNTMLMCFAAIGVVGLALNDALIWLFTDCIGTHYMFSKIVAAAMVYLWNFFARKYLVFR